MKRLKQWWCWLRHTKREIWVVPTVQDGIYVFRRCGVCKIRTAPGGREGMRALTRSSAKIAGIKNYRPNQIIPVHFEPPPGNPVVAGWRA